MYPNINPENRKVEFNRKIVRHCHDSRFVRRSKNISRSWKIHISNSYEMPISANTI